MQRHCLFPLLLLSLCFHYALTIGADQSLLDVDSSGGGGPAKGNASSTFLSSYSSSSFKVFRIFPMDWKDIDALAKLRSSAEDANEIDFWLDARQPGHFADIMVSPSSIPSFVYFLESNNLHYRITIQDVQRLIYLNEGPSSASSSTSHQFKQQHKGRRAKRFDGATSANNSTDLNEEVRLFMESRLGDGPPQSMPNTTTTPWPFESQGRPFESVGQLRGSHYKFGTYSNYAAMLRFMRTATFYYPHIAQLIQLGKTHEGRSIEGLKIGYPSKNKSKPSFWIDGNIHAREWASSHTALFIINQLLHGYGRDRDITRYLNRLNFIIIPCANPDGYEYSRSSLKPQIRLWRKSRSPEQCISSPWGGVKCCSGVDLNRNFDFHWGKSGSSIHPCSNLYAGTAPFSEPETRAIADFLTGQQSSGASSSSPTYANKHHLQAFISLHTYAQLWIHPFSHETQYYPNDVVKVKSVAEKATERLRKVYGTKYRIGTGADLLAPASGGSDDWAKEKMGVKYVYLVELRPQQECEPLGGEVECALIQFDLVSDGFILRQEELIPTAIETFEGIKGVIDAVMEDTSAGSGAAVKGEESTSPEPKPRAEDAPLEEQATTLSPFAGDLLLKLRTTGAVSGTSTTSASVRTSTTSPVAVNKPGIIYPATTTQASTTQAPTTTTSHPPVAVNKPGIIYPATTTQASTTPESTTTTSPHPSPAPAPAPVNKPSFVYTATVDLSMPQQHWPKTPKQDEDIAFQRDPPLPTSMSIAPGGLIMAGDGVDKLLVSMLSTAAVSTTQATETTTTTSTFSTTTEPTSSLVTELFLPTTKAPTRLYALRFLTSEPLSVLMKNRQQAVDNGTRMELPPIIVPTPSPVATTPAEVEPLRLVASTSSSSPPPLNSTTPTTPECVDKKYSCTFWIKAHRNVCGEQSQFMKNNCRFSCGFCVEELREGR